LKNIGNRKPYINYMFNIKYFKALDFFIIASLFIGLFFAIEGLVDKVSPEFFVKKWESAFKNNLFPITALFLLGVVSKIKKIHPLLISLITILGITVLSNNTWPFIVVFWFGLSSYILGSEIYRYFSRIKKDLFNVSSILLGAGIYGTIISLIAHLPINYPVIYSALLLMPLIIFNSRIQNIFLNIKKTFKKETFVSWHDYLISALLVIYYLLALMPEIGHDALASHFFISSHIHDRHQWDFNFNNYVWAVMPALVDFINAIVFMLSGELAPRIMNYVAICLIAYFIYYLVMQYTKDRNSAKLATLLFLSTPLTFLEASTLYIEAIWTLFVLLAFYEILIISNKKEIIANFSPIFLGFAMAAKSVTFMYIPGLIIILFFRCKNFLKDLFCKNLFIFVLIGLLIGIIPYAVAFYHTNNPVFPFFNAFFKSEYFPYYNFDNSLYSHGLTWNFLYAVTFSTGKYLESDFGGSGFYWIVLFFPSLLYLIFNLENLKNTFHIFSFALIGLFFTFLGTAYLRYIFPSYVFFCICLPNANFIYKKSKKILNLFITLVILLNLVFIKSATSYGTINLSSIFNADKRNEYLSLFLPIRNTIKIVNDLNANLSPVLFFSPPLAAGLKSDALHPNWYNSRVQNSMQTIKNKDEMIDFFSIENISFVLIDDSWVTSAFDVKFKKQLIIQITDKVFEERNVQIRKIKDEFIFQHESIKNGNLKSLSGWQFDNHYPYNLTNMSVLADVTHPATQSFNIVSGKKYRIKTLTSCYLEPTQIRSQINWLDVHGNMIDTSIEVYDCSNDKDV